jgi:hypothetical protein
MKIPAAGHNAPARGYFEPIPFVGALTAPSDGCWTETTCWGGGGVLGWLLAGVGEAVLVGWLTTGVGVTTTGELTGAGVAGAAVALR